MATSGYTCGNKHYLQMQLKRMHKDIYLEDNSQGLYFSIEIFAPPRMSFDSSHTYVKESRIEDYDSKEDFWDDAMEEVKDYKLHSCADSCHIDKAQPCVFWEE